MYRLKLIEDHPLFCVVQYTHYSFGVKYQVELRGQEEVFVSSGLNFFTQYCWALI